HGRAALLFRNESDRCIMLSPSHQQTRCHPERSGSKDLLMCKFNPNLGGERMMQSSIEVGIRID
ncbi:MAG: hypothetical protein WA802_09355, partial [Terracidiphilus sp.]